MGCLPNPNKLSILGDIWRSTILPFSSSKYFYSSNLVDLSFQCLSFSNKRKTTVLWGPDRVNSDRRHGSETATWRSWNCGERQAAHAKLRQRQRKKWNRLRHSRFKNKTATCSAFRRKKLHFTKLNFPWVLTVHCVSSDSLLSSTVSYGSFIKQ